MKHLKYLSKFHFLLAILLIGCSHIDFNLKTFKTGSANIQGFIYSSIDGKPVSDVKILINGHDKCDFAGTSFDAAHGVSDSKGYFNINFKRESYFAYTFISSPEGCLDYHSIDLADCYSDKFSFDERIYLKLRKTSFLNFYFNDSYIGDSIQYFDSSEASDTIGKDKYFSGIRVNEVNIYNSFYSIGIDSGYGNSYFIWRDFDKDPLVWKNITIGYTKACSNDTIIIK